MSKQITIGIISGLLGLFLIVIPIFKFIEYCNRPIEAQTITVYVKEIR